MSETVNSATTITQYMTHDHALCDEKYGKAEEAVLSNDFEAAKRDVTSFITSMDRHIAIEEDLLFPEFERQTGMQGGPTYVMRSEHEQFKSIFRQMEESLDKQDFDRINGLGETLVILMQQHNMKEEGMLYPMIDQHLGNSCQSLIEAANKI